MKPGSAIFEGGWTTIDAATVRTCGDVQTVIAEMQATLEQPEVICLCSRLGIHSAGFMFFDRFTRMTRFFGTDESAPPPTYATCYISPTSSVSVDEFEGIHQLFLLLREEQAEWARAKTIDSGATPDYFRYLPGVKELRALVTQEVEFRKRHAVHYCTLGEMVVTVALWRGLSRLKQAGYGELPLSDNLPSRLGKFTHPAGILWKGHDLLARLQGAGGKRLQERWKREFSEAISWKDELRAFGVTGPSGSKITAAAMAFCNAIRLTPESSAAPTAGAFTEYVYDTLVPLLQRLEPNQRPTSVSEALDALERLARFPLLPFYVWNALEREPHVYCIIPVWTSQGYPFEENHHLGFALTALKPNSELDWSILDNTADNLTCDVDPVIITSLLRLAARPLVEHSLYGRLVKHAEEVETQRAAATIQKKLGLLTKGRRRRRR